MLTSRIITAFILIPIVIAVLFLLPLLGFVVVTLMVCMLAAWEWSRLAGFHTSGQRIALAVICGAILVAMFFCTAGQMSSRVAPMIADVLWVASCWWVLALLLVFFYPVSAIWWSRSRLLKIVFGIATIIPFFWGMTALRQYDYANDPYQGAWWLLYVMFLVWSVDSGAYLFGKLFGRNKLAPKVSPGKTWEGFIGGLLTSAFVSWLFGLYAPLMISPKRLLICSVVAALASVLGDLTESMFKREAGMKDSGNIIPGHGGILDRIDSLTAAVPVFACLLLLVF